MQKCSTPAAIFAAPVMPCIGIAVSCVWVPPVLISERRGPQQLTVPSARTAQVSLFADTETASVSSRIGLGVVLPFSSLCPNVGGSPQQLTVPSDVSTQVWLLPAASTGALVSNRGTKKTPASATARTMRPRPMTRGSFAGFRCCEVAGADADHDDGVRTGIASVGLRATRA